MTRLASPRDLATRLARVGIDQDPAHGAVMPPLHLSSNYSFDGLEGKRRYDYSRSGNPTRDLLGEALTALEGGAGTVVTSSGMAAVDLVLSELSPADLILAPHDGYGGTHRLLNARAGKGHLEVAFVDQTDPAALEAALARSPPAGAGRDPIQPPDAPDRHRGRVPRRACRGR